MHSVTGNETRIPSHVMRYHAIDRNYISLVPKQRVNNECSHINRSLTGCTELYTFAVLQMSCVEAMLLSRPPSVTFMHDRRPLPMTNTMQSDLYGSRPTVHARTSRLQC